MTKPRRPPYFSKKDDRASSASVPVEKTNKNPQPNSKSDSLNHVHDKPIQNLNIKYDIRTIAFGPSRRYKLNFAYKPFIFEIDPLYHNTHGLDLLSMGDAAAALSSFDLAITADRMHADAHANRGCALLALDRPTEALAAFDAAIAINPESDSTHFNRGCALKRLGQSVEAVGAFADAVRLSQNEAKYHFALGEGLLEQNVITAGLSEISSAISIKSDIVNSLTLIELIVRAIKKTPYFAFNADMTELDALIRRLAELLKINDKDINDFIKVIRSFSSVSVPSVAPEIYGDRPIDPDTGRPESIIKFLRRVWKDPWIDAGVLSRADLRKLDPQAYMALANWLQKPDNVLPEDLAILKKTQIIDSALSEEQIRAARRLIRAHERRRTPNP